MNYILFKHIHDGVAVFSVLEREIEKADVVFIEEAGITEHQRDVFIRTHREALSGLLSEQEYLNGIGNEPYYQRLHQTLLRFKKPILPIEYYSRSEAVCLEVLHTENILHSEDVFNALIQGNAKQAVAQFKEFITGRDKIDVYRDSKMAAVLQTTNASAYYSNIPEDGTALCLVGKEHKPEIYLPKGFFQEIIVSDIIGDVLPAVLPTEEISVEACVLLAVLGDLLLYRNIPVQEVYDRREKIKRSVDPELLEELAMHVQAKEYDQYLEAAERFFQTRKQFTHYFDI